MRKNYIYFVLLILNISMFGQKVTLTPTLVNGVAYSSGTINLESLSTSSVSLSIKVEIPSTAAVGDQGTIKIYFSKGSALGSNIATGGDGGALYFGGGKVATRSFIINLNWSDFLTSGGFIFAEYNNNSIAYKSSNIPVVKNSTVNSGTIINPPADAPDPNKIVNTICCDQTIRLGDKPAPIIGSRYLNPYEGEPYGIDDSWRDSNGNNSFQSFDDIFKIPLDYITDPKGLTIIRRLGYPFGDYPNKSNTVTIKVVPSPILKNEISINAPINPEGYYEITDTNPKQISGTRFSSQVNLNILADPFHISKRGDSFTEIEKFEWEYKKLNVSSDWTTIANENDYTLKSFNPSDFNSSEDNYYLLRRIAIYQNIKKVSNTLKIVLRTIRLNNTICCDQTLIISAENTIDSPSMIIGSDVTPTTNQYFDYQWQSQSIEAHS